MSNERTIREEVKVQGEHLVEKVKELVRAGNVRRVAVKDKEGKVLAEFPLTFGVVGVVLAPMLAALGGLAAVLTECTLSIERDRQE